MSIERITGSMLRDNLARQGANLAIDTDLTYFDVINRRVGINTLDPHCTLTVNGTACFDANVTLYQDLNVIGNIFVGNIDATPIGVNSPNVGYFTNLYTDEVITSNASITGGTISNVTIIDSVGIFDYFEANVFVSDNVAITGGNITGLDLISSIRGNIDHLYSDDFSANVITANVALIDWLEANVALLDISNSNIAYANLLYANAGVLSNMHRVSSEYGDFANLTANVFSADHAVIADLVVTDLHVTGNATGTVSAAYTTYQLNISQEIGSNVHYMTFADTMNGNANVYTNSALTYIPDIGKLKAFTFEGSGNISTLTINDTKTATTSAVIRGTIDNTLLTATTHSNTYDTIVLGGDTYANPSAIIPGSKLTVNSTDTIILPVGETGQRPSEVGYVDVAGMLRFNSDLLEIEWYDGFRWRSPGEGGTTIAQIYLDSFTADGVTTEYTLRYPATNDKALVFVNGILQESNEDYTITGNVVSFFTSVLSTSEIMVMAVPLIEFREKYISDGVQTFYDTPDQYDVENILVFINGVQQYENTTYTRTRDGILFNTPVSVDYEITFVGLSYIFDTVRFTGDDTTTVFDLGSATETVLVIASVNGLVQHNGKAFKVIDREIIFSEPIPAGLTVEVVIISQSFRTSSIQSTDGSNGILVDNDGISYVIDGRVTEYYTPDGSKVYDPVPTIVSDANVPSTIDVFSRGKYRSAKYTVQAEYNNEFQLLEVMVLHAQGVVTVTGYGVLQTHGNLGLVDAQVVGGNIVVQYIPTNADTSVKTVKTYIEL